MILFAIFREIIDVESTDDDVKAKVDVKDLPPAASYMYVILVKIRL
jgi:hypothetical protein